ncbi:MAG: helix-turn-helix domain-containing protein [Desulfosporosinus sp.]
MIRKLMRICEVADILNVAEDRAYAMAREGILPVIRMGRQLRVDPDQLQIWLDKGGNALPGGWRRQPEDLQGGRLSYGVSGRIK